jgi:hypothetical protein
VLFVRIVPLRKRQTNCVHVYNHSL